MGYITFYCLRNDILEYLKSKDDKARAGTVSFLTQCDVEGNLTYKECRDLLKDISDMEDKGRLYGYVGRGIDTCLTVTKLKTLLKDCVSRRCKLKWN